MGGREEARRGGMNCRCRKERGLFNTTIEAPRGRESAGSNRSCHVKRVLSDGLSLPAPHTIQSRPNSRMIPGRAVRKHPGR